MLKMKLQIRDYAHDAAVHSSFVQWSAVSRGDRYTI